MVKLYIYNPYPFILYQNLVGDRNQYYARDIYGNPGSSKPIKNP